jgi:hypothetical protein
MRLLPLALLAAMLPLAGCMSYPGPYSAGAYNGYDGGFDSGFQGYQRPIIWDDVNHGPTWYGAPGYR